MNHPLLSPEVARALGLVPANSDPLRAARVLRRHLGAEEARAAGELLALRDRARGRLAEAERLLLTRRGLEQASDRRVAARRAERIRRLAPGAAVWDATAGVGSDALACARAGLAVVASDRDPLLARLAARNLAPAGARVLVEAAERPPLAHLDVVLVDPDRRAERAAGREGDPARWSPPLPVALELARRARGACVKLPPGLDPAALDLSSLGGHPLARDPLGATGAAWTWTSVAGELKELALWTGALAPPGEPGRSAVVLDRDGRAAVLAGAPEDVSPLAPEAALGATWLAEPDPAVIAAGLVGRLARALGAAPLGPGLAYLAADERPRSPLVRAFRVLGEAPLDRRRVRALLAAHDVGPLVVKKRGVRESAESLSRRLRGPGRRRGLVLVAPLARGRRAFLVEPEPPEPPAPAA